MKNINKINELGRISRISRISRWVHQRDVPVADNVTPKLGARNPEASAA
jgi:hypothetical protein